LIKQLEVEKNNRKLYEEKMTEETSNLVEHKKVLVKEVKQNRKKLDSLSENLNLLTVQNKYLETEIQFLKDQLQDSAKKLAYQDQEHSKAILSLKDHYESFFNFF